MILILKLVAGFFAFIAACITFLLQKNESPKSQSTINHWKKVSFIFLALSSISYLVLDYLEVEEKRQSELDFRNSMTKISKEILKSNHPYSPKQVRFDYCLNEESLKNIGKRKWGTDSVIEVLSKIEQLREDGFKHLFGAEVTLIFTPEDNFRPSSHTRYIDKDIATLSFQPHQVSEVWNTARSTTKAPIPYCQNWVIEVPEAGFNMFDNFNAIDAQSYYDLANTNLYIYVTATKWALHNGFTSPAIKNLSITFGNGITKFYLKKEDTPERIHTQDKSGVAYKQKSGIPPIEKDFPALKPIS
ncbi:MAG: hypothetical protein HWE34_11915 [Methylocystaceae bacterium]|nr:hypothetical protein [Methylocystaceae bacterium]